MSNSPTIAPSSLFLLFLFFRGDFSYQYCDELLSQIPLDGFQCQYRGCIVWFGQRILLYYYYFEFVLEFWWCQSFISKYARGVRAGHLKTVLRGTFIHNEVFAKAQFKLFLSAYISVKKRGYWNQGYI